MGGIIATQGHCDIWVEPMSGFLALMQQRCVLMSAAPDITKGQEERAVQNWPCSLTDYTTRKNWSCLSPAEALGKEGPTPHLCSTIELTLFAGAWISGP